MKEQNYEIERTKEEKKQEGKNQNHEIERT
jgi:hypothetical protein